MKLKIVPNGTNLKEKTLFTINIGSKLAEKWYNEQARRFGELCLLKEEAHKQYFMAENPVFDIDESYECGIMSLSHLQEFILFIKE